MARPCSSARTRPSKWTTAPASGGHVGLEHNRLLCSRRSSVISQPPETGGTVRARRRDEAGSRNREIRCRAPGAGASQRDGKLLAERLPKRGPACRPRETRPWPTRSRVVAQRPETSTRSGAGESSIMLPQHALLQAKRKAFGAGETWGGRRIQRSPMACRVPPPRRRAAR